MRSRKRDVSLRSEYEYVDHHCNFQASKKRKLDPRNLAGYTCSTNKLQRASALCEIRFTQSPVLGRSIDARLELPPFRIVFLAAGWGRDIVGEGWWRRSGIPGAWGSHRAADAASDDTEEPHESSLMALLRKLGRRHDSIAGACTALLLHARRHCRCCADLCSELCGHN